ncbi:MAG: Sec-independent protein translocase protein TatB [Paracoccus sp. (in: a-proteobacteria)]
MLDIGWSELLVIGVVALIVIGPRDLPHMFHALGRITAKARAMAREFSSAMEDAARDSGLDEVSKSVNEIRDVTSKRSLGVDALDRAAGRFEKWDPKLPGRNPVPPAGTPDPAAAGSAMASALVEDPAAPAPEVAELAAQDIAAGQRRLHAVRRSDSKDV